MLFAFLRPTTTSNTSTPDCEEKKLTAICRSMSFLTPLCKKAQLFHIYRTASINNWFVLCNTHWKCMLCCRSGEWREWQTWQLLTFLGKIVNSNYALFSYRWCTCAVYQSSVSLSVASVCPQWTQLHHSINAITSLVAAQWPQLAKCERCDALTKGAAREDHSHATLLYIYLLNYCNSVVVDTIQWTGSALEAKWRQWWWWRARQD